MKVSTLFTANAINSKPPQQSVEIRRVYVTAFSNPGVFANCGENVICERTTGPPNPCFVLELVGDYLTVQRGNILVCNYENCKQIILKCNYLEFDFLYR